MPKLKLRGWQFIIIAESLKDRAVKELITYYQILRNALSEDFDISDAKSVNSDIFRTKKQEAVLKHERLRDIAKAKIDLFEAEHRDCTLNPEEIQELAHLQTQYSYSETVIEDIKDKFDFISTIENMIVVVEQKANDTDIIKKYDDDPKTSSSDEEIEDDDGDDEPYPPTWNWGD